nr:hypothetical protein [Microbacterium testaceum]
MPVLKKLITVVSVGVLGFFALYVVSTPFLREPPAPVVHVTIEPQPPVETTEPLARDHGETGDVANDEPATTTPANQTGERVGEQLNHLWQQTKEFGTGLWSGLTTKER